MSIAIDNQFWSIKELARVLGISTRSIERKLKDKSGDIPPSIKIGGKRKWHKHSTNNWILRRCGLLSSNKNSESQNDLMGNGWDGLVSPTAAAIGKEYTK